MKFFTFYISEANFLEKFCCYETRLNIAWKGKFVCNFNNFSDRVPTTTGYVSP